MNALRALGTQDGGGHCDRHLIFVCLYKALLCRAQYLSLHVIYLIHLARSSNYKYLPLAIDNGSYTVCDPGCPIRIFL